MVKQSRQQIPSIAPPPPSSYAVQTAESLYKKFGMQLSKEEIIQQITQHPSFYKTLLSLPVMSVHNHILLSQCQELEENCQRQLGNIMAANHEAMIASKRTTPYLSDEKQAQLAMLQHQASQESANLQFNTEQLSLLDEEINNAVREYALQWHTFLDAQVAQLIENLEQNNVSVSATFKERLLERLDKLGSGLMVSSDKIKSLKIKEDSLSAVSLVFLYTLIEEFSDG